MTRFLLTTIRPAFICEFYGNYDDDDVDDNAAAAAADDDGGGGGGGGAGNCLPSVRRRKTRKFRIFFCFFSGPPHPLQQDHTRCMC